MKDSTNADSGLKGIWEAVQYIKDNPLPKWQQDILEQYCPDLWPKERPKLRLVKEESNA